MTMVSMRSLANNQPVGQCKHNGVIAKLIPDATRCAGNSHAQEPPTLAASRQRNERRRKNETLRDSRNDTKCRFGPRKVEGTLNELNNG